MSAVTLVLIILVVLLLLVIIVLLVTAAVERGRQPGPPTAQRPCTETTNVQNLYVIPDGAPDCIINGRQTGLIYIGSDNPKLDYVVAPYGSSIQDVCVQFCTTFTGGQGNTPPTCTGPVVNGRSAQTNYNQCVQQLSSNDCIPPKPIAREGSIIFYAFSPTSSICSSLGGI